MNISSHYFRVMKFMDHAGQEVPRRITAPDEKTAELRARLVLEEAFELVEALGVRVDVKCVDAPPEVGSGWNGALTFKDLKLKVVSAPDLIGIAKECADVSVVNTGTLIACGIHDAAVLEAVDDNNLLKFMHICPGCGKDYDEASFLEQMVAVNPLTGGPHPPGTIMCACGTTFITGYRREDGKWVKPVNHPKPDIQGVFRAQDGAWIEKEKQANG